METAVNIAYSSGILDQHSKLLEILCEKDLTYDDYNSVIIEGDVLASLQHSTKLAKILKKVKVLVACRTSPKQKADVIGIVRSIDRELTVLAIGDGANDVAMILQSDVGVGISGKEGNQASKSADFSID